MQDIKISEILDDLERGLSRESTSPDYNPELGSIKDKYNLTKKELKYLFSHPSLKGKRTKLPVMFNLIDDTIKEEVEIPQNTEIASAVVEEQIVTQENW